MKAIETYYNGYRFRSRLEARWAVFFDTCNIKFEYEPQGYVLKNGDTYLPDFYLPFFGKCYCEVKPYGGNFSKAIDFAIESKSSIVLLEGPPDFVAYDMAFGEDHENWTTVEVAFLYMDAAHDNRFYYSGIFDVDGNEARRLSKLDEELFHDIVHEAINASRAFR